MKNTKKPIIATSIYLPRKLHQEVKLAAVAQGITISKVFMEAYDLWRQAHAASLADVPVPLSETPSAVSPALLG